MTETSRSRNVLLAPSGSDGDIFPMVALAKRLRARGHVVRACSVPSAKPHFEGAGIPFLESGLDVRAFTRDKNLASLTPSARLADVSFLRRDVIRQFAVLREAAESADLLLSGGYNYAAGSVAESRRIPHLHVFHVPNVYPTAEHPCMGVPWQGLPTAGNRATWKMNAFLQNRIFRATLNRERAALGLAKIGDVWSNFIAHSLVAIPRPLHAVPADGPERLQTSYWFPEEEDELPDDLRRFLDAGPRPFYFGLGSMPTDAKRKTMGAISAICREFRTRAIVSRGWAEFESAGDPAIFFAGKISHARLFERLELVIHHGGPGTVSTAARAGAVQILIPHIFDQFYWGGRVERLGLGPAAIPHGKFGVESLRDRFRRVREDPGFAERAGAMRIRLRDEDGIREFLRPEFLARTGIGAL